jgi:hypothetical protein
VATFGTETEHRKVIVERCAAFYTQPQHDREAGAVGDRKILVSPGLTNLPGSLEIGLPNWFYGNATVT